MIPKRAISALVTTVFALVLLLSFKTPESPGLASSTSSDTAIVGAPTTTQAPTATSGTSGTATDAGTTGTTEDRGPHRGSDQDTTTTAGYADGTVTGDVVTTRFGASRSRSRSPAAGSPMSRPSSSPRRAVGADLVRCRAAAPQRGPDRPEREHRHRVRRDVHERRLRRVAPVGARPGPGLKGGRRRGAAWVADDALGPSRPTWGRRDHGHRHRRRYPRSGRPARRSWRTCSPRSARWTSRFSPFKPDSEVSRLCAVSSRRALRARTSAPSSICARVMASLHGRVLRCPRHRPDGMTDPAGIVKGWSIERAARLARGGRSARSRDQCRRRRPRPRRPRTGSPWRVGIQHPRIAGPGGRRAGDPRRGRRDVRRV